MRTHGRRPTEGGFKFSSGRARKCQWIGQGEGCTKDATRDSHCAEHYAICHTKPKPHSPVHPKRFRKVSRLNLWAGG